jgi:hypothetical protein
MYLKLPLLISLLLLSIGCQEKAKPIISKNAKLQAPLGCLKLGLLEEDGEFVKTLHILYSFKKDCPYRLSFSYKKDIVCNSSYNVSMKNMGKFPRSFVKLDVRNGLDSLYSYYVDLYSNVDEDDVVDGFLQLKKDVL